MDPSSIHKSFKIAGNKLGSGIGACDFNLRDLRAESCRYFATGKTVDRSILRLERQDSPILDSTGGDPLRKISKAVAPHDTEQVFGKSRTRPSESLSILETAATPQGKMLSLGRLILHPDTEHFNLLLSQASPIILTTLISLVLFHGYLLIQQSNGGSDLVSADIPKSLMLLAGQNPYSTQPWASPYPPLLLLTVSGIIRLTTLFTAQSSLDLISQQLRLVGLLADAAVAIIIYLAIRSRTSNPLQSLIPASLFLALPAISTSPLYFFHSDTFAYPILALATFTLARHRYLVGTTLLATATVFKIHPVLALPLVMIWLFRTQGLHRTLPSLATATIITGVGLILPLTIPGYEQSILGFNFTNQGNGTTLTTMNILNTILPSSLQLAPTERFTNQIWIATTAALYTIVLATVWTRARSLSSIDVILLGLLAWLIPLKIVYAHYIVWAVVPFLMRGRLIQTVIVAGLLQIADTLAYWSSSPGSSPIPAIVTSSGPVLTSLVIRTIGVAALIFVLNSSRKYQSRPLGGLSRSIPMRVTAVRSRDM